MVVNEVESLENVLFDDYLSGKIGINRNKLYELYFANPERSAEIMDFLAETRRLTARNTISKSAVLTKHSTFSSQEDISKVVEQNAIDFKQNELKKIEETNESNKIIEPVYEIPKKTNGHSHPKLNGFSEKKNGTTVNCSNVEEAIECTDVFGYYTLKQKNELMREFLERYEDVTIRSLTNLFRFIEQSPKPSPDNFKDKFLLSYNQLIHRFDSHRMPYKLAMRFFNEIYPEHEWPNKSVVKQYMF
ncbi:hypothetical protein JXA48_03695 [Candidatus Woesearchaeota archaeon]|nr:hypothetical protein [Candidatus Woesearchaeota archaeon]